MLDPRDLEALIAVADHGAVAAAARALHCTQPAVSRRLQRLERQVGSELLQRRSDGTLLLEAGERLAARSRAVLQALTDLQRDPTARKPVVGVLPSVEAWMVPNLLHRLPTSSAETVLPVNLGAVGGFQAVAQGNADAAIVTEWRREHVPEGVAVLDLLLEPYAMLCEPGHALLAHHSLGAGALRGQAVVSAPHPDCGGSWAEGGGSQRTAASLVHAHELVARGGAVAVWPACTASSSRVTARGFSDPRIARRLAVAVPARSLRSPAMRRIVEAVADAFRARPGQRGRLLWRGIPAPSVR